MKLSTKIILPIILISALLILLAGCFGVPSDESPGYTTPDTYTMTIVVIPEDGGAVSGGGTYTAGTVVDITATPNSGYQFSNWIGDVADTSLPATMVTMDDDKTVIAIFSEIPSNGSPEYTPGSITGRIMVPEDCSDCLTDGPCLTRGISDDIPEHWVPAEEAIVTVIPHATLTDEDGYYTLTDIEPGVYYVITATYKNVVLKDVVEPNGVEAGEPYDAGTANCESTALALVVEYLWDMELDADEIEATLETYIETDKFADLVDTVCCIIENCDNITNYCCLVECDEPEFTCSTTSLYMSIPTPACDETCTTISKPITVRFVGKDDVVINNFSDSRLDWTIPSGVSFAESSGEVCLTGAVGTYNIKVTYVDPEPDLCGSVSRTIPVAFSDCPCPLPIADAGEPYVETLVCPVDGPDDDVEVTFSGSASGAGTFTYDWDFGDGGSSTLQNPTHTYTSPAPASYNVTLTVTGDGENTCGSDTDATTVTINYVPCCPLPIADAGEPYVETLVCPVDGPDDDVEVTFSGSASGAGTFTYDWDFGDGGSSTLQNPTHTYTSPAPASYNVTLTVTGDGENTCGSDTDATTVTINYVPCEPITYTLTMAVDPTGGGTTNPAVGSHTYPENEGVTLNATPALGYHFVEWTGDALSTNPTTSVTMDGDKTVTANFAPTGIITSINIAGWENAGCNPNFDHPHLPYSYIDSDPSGISGTIPLQWLTVTNPNLKSVHFFADVDADDVVEYQYTTDMGGSVFTGWITLGGGYVSSECIEIPGAIESPPVYPTDFYIEIRVNGDIKCTIHIY